MSTKENIVAAGAFQNYISKAANTDVVAAIRLNTKEFKKLLKEIPNKKRNYAYAEGKWTIKELLQHIIDAERVFAYRALRFARLDLTPLPGFDENTWAVAANKIDRKWDDLVKEFKTVRASSELLFESLGEPELLFAGTASNQPLNALAMGYVIAGHARHHADIIKERYLKKK
jgi:DinB superfamily